MAIRGKKDKLDQNQQLVENGNHLKGSEDEPFRPLEEGLHLFQIGLPTVMMQFSLYWIFPLSASSVGRHLGIVELGGFSLGALVGNLTCLSIMEGSLYAADTLMPRAFGAQRYEEMGRLAVRSALIGALLLAIPVLPLCLYSGRVLQTLGQDAEASMLAQSWIRMYFIGAPPNLAFRVLMRFLLAQNKPWRLVISTIIPAVFLHPFLLKIFVPTLELEGSALAIAITQWVMLFFLLVLLWIKPVHMPETWPGMSWEFLTGVCECDNMLLYLRLAVGGILSVNEWWFFEIMCFTAGSFGVESLDAHTIAYNLVPLFFMIPLGIGIGLSIRMGTIFALDPRKAWKIAAGCMCFIVLLGLVLMSMLYTFRRGIISLFTDDALATKLALSIWTILCYYIFLLYIMGISVSILRALGMQWRAAGIISTALFCLTLPLVMYFAVYKKGGLVIQWRVLGVCYTFLQIFLILGFLVLDWDKHAVKVRESIAHMATGSKIPNEKNTIPSETTPLVV